MSASVLKPEEVQELVRLMAKTPARHRYVLVQRASGELVFVQEEIDAMIEQAIAAPFAVAYREWQDAQRGDGGRPSTQSCVGSEEAEHENVVQRGNVRSAAWPRSFTLSDTCSAEDSEGVPE